MAARYHQRDRGAPFTSAAKVLRGLRILWAAPSSAARRASCRGAACASWYGWSVFAAWVFPLRPAVAGHAPLGRHGVV
eukprot:13162267-Alexandrium_andersonii.AAC.1